jgi:hypothetical protein
VASIKKRPDGRWRARYRDAAKKEHAKHFDRRVDAQDWLDEKTASLVRHDYVDPDRGRLTVGEWADSFMASRVHLKPKTVASYESLLRTRILPVWASVSLADVRNADGTAVGGVDAV